MADDQQRNIGNWGQIDVYLTMSCMVSLGGACMAWQVMCLVACVCVRQTPVIIIIIIMPHGLCSTAGIPVPSSLRNIYKELADDVGVSKPNHGCLQQVRRALQLCCHQ